MLSRRQFLASAGISLASAKLLAQTPAPIAVSTRLGRLRGAVKDGVRSWKGVPFAKPPVGPLRFHPPQPMEAWEGTRDALKFAPIAMQPGDREVAQSEDCLYLNVWAPEAPGPHPVYVWIHGGGFVGGRSSDPAIDGAAFAVDGIVCVTVAYRLGVFGFLDVSPMLGDAYRGSANNALRDLIAALTWVQENIASFGGDPKHVTVGGQSAGAKLTDILLGVPSAQPLFQQAISESGGAERVSSAAQSAAFASAFAKYMERTAGISPAGIATADARKLIDGQQEFTREWPLHFPLRPQVDGVLLAQLPLAAIRAGSSKGKRLLLGTNHDESAAFLGPHPAEDPTAKDLGNVPLEQFNQVFAKYKQLYPAMPMEALRVHTVTAEEYWVPSMQVVEAHTATGSPAFVYRFDEKATAGRYNGLAAHSAELAYVWSHTKPGDPEQVHSLSREMHAAWVAFVAGRAPDAAGLPAWPQWTAGQRKTMIFDRDSRVVSAPDAAEEPLWNVAAR